MDQEVAGRRDVFSDKKQTDPLVTSPDVAVRLEPNMGGVGGHRVFKTDYKGSAVGEGHPDLKRKTS